MTTHDDMPAGEGSTGMVLSEHANDANAGPVVPNRTPMALTLAAMGVLLVLIVAGIVVGVANLTH
jgi:hypothetical protein